MHSNDIELILRSLALLEEGDNYTPKMVSLLNMFSQKSKKFSDEHISYLKELFLSFVSACSTLEQRAFLRNNRFSKTLFESVFVATCYKYFQTGNILNKKMDASSFNILKNDELFLSYLQSGSSSKENISGRINRTKEIIKITGENDYE